MTNDIQAQITFTSEDVIEYNQGKQNSIEKVLEYQAIDVSFVKEINTKYGKKMIMSSWTNGFTYWVPSNLVKFIVKYPYLKQGFTLLTHENKTYKSNNGHEYQAPEFKIIYPKIKAEDLDNEPYYQAIKEHRGY